MKWAASSKLRWCGERRQRLRNDGKISFKFLTNLITNINSNLNLDKFECMHPKCVLGMTTGSVTIQEMSFLYEFENGEKAEE